MRDDQSATDESKKNVFLIFCNTSTLYLLLRREEVIRVESTVSDTYPITAVTSEMLESRHSIR